MGDQDQTTPDTGIVVPPIVEPDPAQGADTLGAEGEKLILGKYKSMEDAEKGVAELNKQYGNQSREVGELRQQMETLRVQAQLAEKLDAIARNTSPKEKEPDFDTYAEQMAEKYDANPEMLKEILRVQSSWIAESEKRVSQGRDSKVAELEKALTAIREEQVKLSPSYQENRELIELATSQGVSVEQAMKIVASLKSKIAPTAPPRVDPPTGMGPQRAGAGGKRIPWFSETDRAEMVRDGLSAEDIEAAEAAHWARIESASKSKGDA